MFSQSAIHQAERRERRGRWFVALATLVSIAVLAASWVGLFSFLPANSAYGTFSDLQERYLPDTDAMALDLPDLSRVSRIYTQDGVLLAELHDGRNSEPVRYEDVPDTVIYSTLAAEDAEFFEHHGIDFEAIFSAFLDSASGGTVRGGSTITQQVVKQNFVGDELTFDRKVAEAWVSAELERRYTKEQILEFYLNSVYYGASAYGIKAAAREFFDKDLDQLSVAEASTLAVQIRNPSLYDPRRQPERALDRRNDVIDTMAKHGFITRIRATQEKEAPLGVVEPTDFVGPADHVVAEVKRQLLNDAEFTVLGGTKDERKVSIFGCPASDTSCEGGGGLNIYVTIDLELQNQANELLQRWLPPGEGEVSTPTGAIATVDNRTGAVLVMASGLPFDVEQFDLATQGRRNPGSSFKPFTLVAGLEQGISLNSFWDSSSPKDIQCPYRCSDKGNIWTVSNAGGGGGGLLRLYDATRNSVNVVYAQLAMEVGPENIVEMAERMGIQSPLRAVPSITLGTSEVTPLEMASAYGNFATNGVHAEPYLVDRIEDPEGGLVFRHDVSQIQIVDDPAIFASARRPLERVPIDGTAPRANIGRPQYGKTGTHQDYKDAWFVGGVPQYSTAVWVGYKDAQIPLENVTINGEFYSRVFGGSVPAPIWKEFMQIVLADQPVEEFPTDPAGVDYFFRTPTTTVPSVVGQSRSSAIREIQSAKLSASVREVYSSEPEGTVVSQSPGAGTTVAQGSAVVISVSSGRPPTVALPNLKWISLDAALGAIASFEASSGIRLNVNVAQRDAEYANHIGLVVDTRPGPGGAVGNGDTVTLVVGRAPGG